MFDVWQTSSPNKLPEYAIETTRFKIKDVLKQTKLDVKRFSMDKHYFIF